MTPEQDEDSAFRRRYARYDIVVDELDDGTCYWHLFCNGERINGGISTDPVEARARAGEMISSYIYGTS